MAENVARQVTAYRFQGKLDPGAASGMFRATAELQGTVSAGDLVIAMQAPITGVYLLEGFTVETVGADLFEVITQADLMEVTFTLKIAGGTTVASMSKFIANSGRIRVYSAAEAGGGLWAMRKSNTNAELDHFSVWGLWWDMALARAAGVMPAIK